ncbi:MAG: tRNA lysidine(34) synthetase TilS [Verrucomicrobiota bacterium]
MKIPWLEHASRHKKLMVGVSGGLDSVALLHLLNEAGFKKVVVCHLDHGLRGAESAGDAQFVKRVSKRLGYEVMSVKVDLRERMARTAVSLETAGRVARHEFFANCSKQQRCKILLLAHHADDQAETILWNLLRGSLGCRGMSEMTELSIDGRSMIVVRPLLEIRKADLQSWMLERKLSWREDATNAVNDVVRNRLRNEAIPLLGEITKRDITPSLIRAAEIDSEWRELLDWSIATAAASDPQGRLHTGAMKNLPAVLSRAVIADYLKKQQIENVDWRLLERCVELLDVEKPASVNLPGGKRLRRKAGRIFLEEL